MAKLSKKIEELNEKRKQVTAELDHELRREITDILRTQGVLDTEDAELGVVPTERYIEINVEDPEHGELVDVRIDEMTGDVWATEMEMCDHIDLLDLCSDTLIEILEQL